MVVAPGGRGLRFPDPLRRVRNSDTGSTGSRNAGSDVKYLFTAGSGRRRGGLCQSGERGKYRGGGVAGLIRSGPEKWYNRESDPESESLRMVVLRPRVNCSYSSTSGISRLRIRVRLLSILHRSSITQARSHESKNVAYTKYVEFSEPLLTTNVIRHIAAMNTILNTNQQVFIFPAPLKMVQLYFGNNEIVRDVQH